MSNMRCLVLLLVVVVVVKQTQASHFRGAIITWKPGSNPNELDIEYRISWRMTYSSLFTCDSKIVQQRTLIGGEGSIECFRYCNGVIGNLYYTCTDYSTTEDWSSGRGSMTYTYDRGSKYLEFGFSSRAWISQLNYGASGNWVLRVAAHLLVRSDTGRINSSPTAEISPIVRLAYGCNHTISIPVSDADGDVVRCSWATNQKNQCGSVCYGFPYSDLNYDTCIITYEARYSLGWYAVAIQVEDYSSTNATSSMSSIPVQFLVKVEQNPSGICAKLIEFIKPTLPENACVGVLPGHKFESAIVARVSNTNRSISQISTISPVGLTKTELFKVSHTSWRLNWTYAPPANGDKTHAFCFTATDDEGSQSKRRCVTLLVGVLPPQFVNGTQTPKNVLPDNRHWEISSSLEFVRTLRSSFIHLYNSKDQLLESLDVSNNGDVNVNTAKKTVDFSTKTPLKEKEEYYFTFDFGVLKGVTDCGVESLPIDDPYFWRFRVRDVTPPSLFLTKKTIKTNATAELEWTVNEPVTSSCLLRYPDGKIEDYACNNSWTQSDLTEGIYTLKIKATDLEGNNASLTHTWLVDTRPPSVSFLLTPGHISGSDPVDFRWNCSPPCQTSCSIENVDQTLVCSKHHLSWKVPKKQSNVTYTFQLQAIDDVGNVETINHTWTTDFVPPKITSCAKGQSLSVDCTGDIKPESICNVTANDNMDLSPFLNYTDKTVGSCRLHRIWTTMDDAGNRAKYTQNITIKREGPIEINQLKPVSVACGALHNMTSALKSMFRIKHPCDLDVNITYKDNVTETCDSIIERSWKISDNCGADVTATQIIKIRKTRLPLAPENGQVGIDLSSYLRWQGSASVTNYDVYLWERDTPRPKIPISVTNEDYYYADTLKPGTMYRWQVVFNYDSGETYLSPIWVFETRNFADLAVYDIEVPASSLTGQNCVVKWTVKNNGGLATQQSYWIDAVFMSWDENFENAKLVTTVPRRDILYNGDSYSTIATFKLNKKEFGLAYIFVRTNYGGNIEEHNKNNNMKRSSASVHVKLTPPPDLQIASIQPPAGLVFSGSHVTISWTVVNVGTGPTKVGHWFDTVWWSPTKGLGNNAKKMATVEHSGNLGINTNYTQKLSLLIPEFIYGKYFFIVNVDAFNQVFEYLSENNTFTSQEPTEVKLTSPPDLAVKSIQTPTVWRTGDTVTVNWTVENSGSDSPRSQMYWKDVAIIVANAGTRFIGSNTHYGMLRAYEKYWSILSFFVSPNIPSGYYNVTVTTDYNDNVFEYNMNDNNVFTNSIRVVQELPDLRVLNCSFSIEYNTNSTKVIAKWQVKNSGNGRTLANEWIDTISVKTPEDYYYSVLNYTHITTKNGLIPSESYNCSEIIDLPFEFYGRLFFKVTLDDLYKATGDFDRNNNIFTASNINVKLKAADLIVEIKSVSEYIVGGKDLHITYVLKNQGNRGVKNSRWRNRIFISKNANYENAVFGIDRMHFVTGDLNQNGSREFRIVLSLPEEMSGRFYLVIIADVGNDIFEGPNELNNRVSKGLEVETAPAADLTIMSITADVSEGFGTNKILSVEWEVKNVGNSMHKIQSWQDSIFLKHISSISTLNRYTITKNLESHASYRQRKKLIIPTAVAGDIYICIETDVFGNIYEADITENNVLCQENLVFIQRPTAAKLTAKLEKLTSDTESGKIVPGSKVIAHFTVQNIGGSSTTMSSWTDTIYTSYTSGDNQNSLAERKHVRVKDIIHIGDLDPYQSYSVKTAFLNPALNLGNPVIFIIANNTYSNDQYENNIISGGDDDHESHTDHPNVTDSHFQQIEVSFILPNLHIAKGSIPNNTQGGQPVTIEYEIINTGNVSVNAMWYDSAYLSKDIIVDAFDTKLASVQRRMEIEAGENVTVNVSFILPLDLATQSYYLTIFTDSRDDIFEENEKDNSFKIVFNMEGRQSADIVVAKVETPVTTEYGSAINVSWQVANNGTKQVSGYKCDSVYLSTDNTWDINDAQVGQPVCSKFTLDAHSQSVHSDFLKTETPVVPAAFYNTLVKSRSNIIDMNLQNNVGTASHKTKIVYTVRGVGSKISKTLQSNNLLMIRYVNVLEDMTLIFNITSDCNDAFNSVFIKGGSPATRYDFDKSSDNPNRPEQIIAVPDTRHSEYYVLIENSGSLNSVSNQNITLTVKYAQFEVIDVFPKSLIPNAETTLHLSGALFPYDTHIELSNKARTIRALKTYIFSSTDAYATFHISETTALETLNLTLISKSLNKTIWFRTGITLTKGTTGYLIYSTESPSRLRNGETGIISLNLQNAGDSDLYVPLIAVEASDQGSLRLIDEAKRHNFEQRYVVLCSMENGPAGILPPKSKCQLKFETKQNETYRSGIIQMTLDTYAIRQTNETPNPYIDMKEYLQPTHYSESEWSRVWSNFITATGNSSLSLSRKLSDVLNEMSLGGRYVKNVDDLIGYLLEYADAPYNERYLVVQSDFRIYSDSEIRLEVNRYLSSRIGSRSQVGYMGKGWILPLWDTKIKKMTENDLTLTVEKIDYHFVKLRNNSYIHDKLGVIEETSTEFIHIPYKQRKEFHFDRQTFALTKLASLIDDSYLRMQYDSSLLTKIQHSSGAFVTVKYDKHGRIQTMQLHNSTIATDNANLLCAYDLDSGMLSLVRLNGRTTRYAYFQDYSLKYMIYPDRLMILYEYSRTGHMISKKNIQNDSPVMKREFSYSSGAMVTVNSYPENNVYSLTFDENGEIILVQRRGFLPDRTVKTPESEIQYDGDMVVTKWMFSNNGHSLIVEDGNGDKLWTYFNNKSQLIRFKDGSENEYKINLNNNGSVRNIIFPDGSNKTYMYVQNGHTVVTQNSGIKKYVYNERKQLTMKNIGNNSMYTYNYNENGMLVNAENENGKIAMSYDHDKITDISYDDVKINYEYSNKGLLSRLSTDNDYFVKYDYDGFGRVQFVKDKEDKNILQVKYNSAGKIEEKVLGNNATTSYKYDLITGLLQNMTNYFPNGSVASYYRYKYSIHLRRVVVETHAGTWKYKYDRAGQVVSMTDPNGIVTEYMYDNRKNRILVSVNGYDQETKVNNMNQYMKYRNKSYSYDNNGNMKYRGGSTSEYFTFDEDNKFIAFRSNKHECNFQYDALENLYAKKCNTSTARYIINPEGNYGSDVIEQIIEQNGNKTRVQYYHGGDQIGLIAAKYDDGNMLYFMYDPLGTVQNILSDGGALINGYVYDPFGNAITSKENLKTPFTFVGQWGIVDFEEIPGVYFMRSRLYDSYTGRFLSIDAYGLKAHSKNLYAYCSNNPVHFTDPKGEFPPILAAAATGLAYSVFEYAITTPYKDWTLGGATGAAVSGAIKGAFLIPGGGLLLGVGVSTGADLAGGYIQRKIDHQPYTFQDTKSDFIKSVTGQVIKLPNLVKKGLRGLQIACQVADFLNLTKPEVCDVLMNDFFPITKSFIGWVVSKDPNDILGPDGVGAAKFISKMSSLAYKIRFENDENATAPAQRVYIEHKYSKHVDPRSFKLGELGFGKFTEKINRQSFQKTIDLTSEYGIVLRIFAGLDLIKQMVVWEFQTLDPETGEPPIDPGIGFLPPNNGTSGQGYVSFSMQPKEEVDHLSTIHANASIYFDQNDPIDTPNIFNTIDDSAPTVNGSVITETESSDSVTLSFSGVDSGSGVKYIDLFQQQGNSFSMFRPGITEDIYIMPLHPGDSYSLVAIANDYVGNREEIGNLSPEKIMTVTSTKPTGDCECSGNGNCSSGVDVCICVDGFYGPYCNSSIPPPEPPVLELQSEAGFVNEPIQLTIAARNLSGSLDEMEIFVSGFQNGTVFSAGTSLTDGKLYLTHEEFGTLNMTARERGQFKLNIIVVQTSTDWNFTRSGELLVKVFEKIQGVSIDLQGCVEEYNGRNVVLLNSSIVFDSGSDSNNISSIVPHSTLLKLPNWVHPLNKQTSKTGIYVINDTLFDSILSIDNKIEPFLLSVSVHLEYSGLPSSTFSKELKITQFCGRECDSYKYGIHCDQPCRCNLQNTEICDRFTGSCICTAEWKGPTCNDSACPCISNNTADCEPDTESCLCKNGWTGSKCEIDIDECTNETICDIVQNTTCINRDWGYDCICHAGYERKGDRCVECVDGQYGMKCEGICNCSTNTTIECEKTNGTCICETEWTGATCSDFACPCVVNNTAKCDPVTEKCDCKEGWTGSGCDTDIYECDDSTVCKGKNHTTCQNKIPGYDCLCRLGYKMDDDALCVEKTEQGENSMVNITHDERLTPVTIRLDIDVPSTDNLQVEVTYQKYKDRAVDMLTDYYKNELGDSFIRVIVQNISLGSLVIEHDVVTNETEQVSEHLAVAVVQMKTARLTFNGQNVSVKSVRLNQTEVKDNVCEVLMSFDPCNSTVCKKDDQGRPKCRKLNTDNQKDYTVLIISLSTSIPVAILITALIVGFCLRKNREEDSKKISDDNVQFRSKSYVYEHANPGYDDTETEDDGGSYITLKSSTINKRYDFLNQWQDNPYYDQSSSSSRGKYDAERDAYVYNGSSK